MVRVVEKMIEEMYEEQLDVEQKSNKVVVQRKPELEADLVGSEGAEREEEAVRQGNANMRRQRLAIRKEMQR